MISSYSETMSLNDICDPETIILSKELELAAHDPVLQVGPFKVTLVDLWTLLPPGKIGRNELQNIMKEQRTFVQGWLADTVSMQYQSHPC